MTDYTRITDTVVHFVTNRVNSSHILRLSAILNNEKTGRVLTSRINVYHLETDTL